MQRTALMLYRRHTKTCAVHETKLTAQAKRRFMDCACPLWIYGYTDDAYVPRQSTGTSKLAVAEAQRQALLKKSLDQLAHGPRIDDCIERFIAAHQSDINDKTVEVYKRQLERLRAYCERRGAYFTRDLTVDLLEDFKVDGLPAGLSAVTKKNIVALCAASFVSLSGAAG